MRRSALRARFLKVAGVAGAMSMAAGEYVSVSSQADSERADIARERRELQDDPAGELEELAGIYGKRGLDPDPAHRVAEQLMERDALGARRTPATTARPVQAALAGLFAIGAALPLLLVIVAPVQTLVAAVCIAYCFWHCSGRARQKRAAHRLLNATIRVTFWAPWRGGRPESAWRSGNGSKYSGPIRCNRRRTSGG
jgi:hypothetical protein